MAKKLLTGILVLTAGFILGGAVLLIVGMKYASRSSLPRVSAQIERSGKAFSGIVNSVSPTVVNISTVKANKRDSSYMEDPFFDFFKDFFNPPYDYGTRKRWKEQSFGSGVIVSSDGYIITNNHVISGAEKIKVTLYDRRVLPGRVMGADPKTDIAVVKIAADDLPTIPWGDSDSLLVGEFVLAIGDPFGLSRTVTMGIISAVGRANVGIADYEDFIQTDAAINPGNSGGPLVDAEGNLIGINTAIFSRSGGYQGIGFAVPSNMVRLVMEQLLKDGRVIRGWLGVSMQELTPELGRKFGLETSRGALVGEALRDSPAKEAGIRSGDIIVEYGGREVEGPAELKNMVAKSRPGTRISVKILRDGALMGAMVTVGEPRRESERPTLKRAAPAGRDAFYGLSVIALTEEIARQLNLGSEAHGVVAASVQEGSPAYEAGLKRGDLIQEIDRRKIRGLGDFKKASSALSREEAVLMFINRGGRKFYVTLGVS